MENNKTIIVGVIVAVALVVLGAVALTGNDDTSTNDSSAETSQTEQSQTTPEPAQQEEAAAPSSTIVELAQATDALSTLVSAVVQAELVDTLSSEGPFTVFAPTNDAFATLLSNLGITAEQLLAREDLGSILTYHVVPGKVMAADLSDGQVVTTVQGESLTVTIGAGGVTLTDANGGVATVATTDIEASNGVVHVIDTVVLPTL